MSHLNEIFIGAYKKNGQNEVFKWYDTETPTPMQPTVQYNNYYYGLHMDNTGSISAYLMTNRWRNPLCLVNIFELPW